MPGHPLRLITAGPGSAELVFAALVVSAALEALT